MAEESPLEDTPQCRRSLAQEHLQLQRDLNDLSNIVQSLTVGRYHLSVFDELARCRKVELQQLQAKLDNPSDVSLGTLTTSSPIKRSFDKLLRRTSSESRSPTEDGTDAQHGWEEQRLKALKSAHQEKKRHMNDLCTSRESLKAYLDDLESRQKDLTIATDNWQSRMQRIYTYIFSTPSQFPQQDDMVLAQETATEACATATKDRHSAWMAHNFVLRGGKALRTTAIRLERILTKSTMLKSSEGLRKNSMQVLSDCRAHLTFAQEAFQRSSELRGPVTEAAKSEKQISNEVESARDFVVALLSSRQFASTSHRVRLLAALDGVKPIATTMFEATLQLSASSLHESETVLGLAQQKGMQAQFELEQLRIRILAELAGVEIGNCSALQLPNSEHHGDRAQVPDLGEHLPPYSPASPLASFT